MSKLTPTMRMALAEIEREPGQLAAHLPGGRNTVEALMRRGLVEIAGSEWRTYLPEHVHTFAPGLHMDGCHWFGDSGTCECGVMYSAMNERSVTFDPYSAILMEPLGSTECIRCEQLLNGARPRSEVVIERRSNANKATV
jgi:hypothetical protein